MKKETVTLGSESHPPTVSGQYNPQISGHPGSQERKEEAHSEPGVFTCWIESCRSDWGITWILEIAYARLDAKRGRTSDGNIEQWLLFTHEGREQWCVSIKCVVRRVTHIWAVIGIFLAIRPSLILQQIFPYQNWLCSFFRSARITWCARLSMAASTYTGIDYIKRASSVEKFNLLAICSKDIFLRKKNVSHHWKD